MSTSHTVSKILSIKLWRDLEIWVGSQSLKVTENGINRKHGDGFLFAFQWLYLVPFQR